MYHVYILKNESGKTYVGFTSKEVEKRLSEHNLGCNTWTNHNKPFKIVYYESFYCEKDARARELFLKSGIGRKLTRLITDNFNGV